MDEFQVGLALNYLPTYNEEIWPTYMYMCITVQQMMFLSSHFCYCLFHTLYLV